ncbi:MAG: lipase [Paracoccaceae bacterium]
MKGEQSVPQPVFVRSFGQGARQVLALHCTIAHSGAWRGLAERMGDEVTLITPDMLSHGRSLDWDKQGDFQDRSVAAVSHLLDDPPEGTVDVIGHSFGATIALRLALAYPDRVRSLTMIEPVFFAVALQDDPQSVADHDVGAASYVAAMRAGDDALAARLFNKMWSEDGTRWSDLPETTRGAMTRSIGVVAATYPAVYEDHAGMLAPGVLDRATMPALLLRGSQTHPVVDAVNEGLAQRLPDAQSVVIEGAGHMLPITHPGATAAELRRLFQRVPG